MALAKETVYIKGDQNVEVTKREITLGDILSIECANVEMIPKIKTLKLLKIQDDKKHRYVVSILKIIECIHRQYPNVDVENVGKEDIIITCENKKTPSKYLHWIKVIVVTIITFIGAAFSIMAFNNDVETTKLFGQIYTLVMGKQNKGFTVLELMYCVGLIVGILIFFNHFGGKRFSVDPTPMEVEMRLYENDIQTTLIENYSRKEKELDVGEATSASTYRA
ncbi:stage V sporulation protein AA [Faecalimonas sp.]